MGTTSTAPIRPAPRLAHPRLGEAHTDTRALRPLTRSAQFWVFAVVFTSISRVHAQVSVLATLRLPLVLSLVALVAVFMESGKWRPRDLTRHWVPRWIGIIAVFAILGVPFGIYPGAAFAFLKDAWLRTLLLSVLVWAVARSTEGTNLMARAVASGGVAAAIQAIIANRRDREGRLAGAFMYDPNDLALVCVVTVPILVWWYGSSKSKMRPLLLTLLPLLFWTIVRTGSRGGFLGVITIVLGIFLLPMLKVSKRTRRIGIAGIVASLFAIPLMPPVYRERMMTIFSSEEDYNRTSQTGRIEIWRRGIGYAMMFPVFGVGINNYPSAEGRISERAKNREPGKGFKWSAAHNSFVQVLSEIGIVSGVLFFAMMIRLPLALFLRFPQRRNHDPTHPDSLLAPFLGLAIAGYAVSGFFLSVAYYDLLYIILAIGSALLLRAQSPAHATRTKR